MYLEAIKERARIIYAWAAQLLLFLLMLFYLLGCGVAGKPIALKEYVNFMDHCFQWVPESRANPPVADVQER
jgi:hypothetical protein